MSLLPVLLLLPAIGLAGPTPWGGPPGDPAWDAGCGAAPASVERMLEIGRLQYGGGGDWYANPTSLPNLLEAVRRTTGMVTAQREVVVTPLDPRLPELAFVHMTGHGNVSFTPAEREALRAWLRGGGFLHADDNYGLDASFRRELGLLFPETELVELPADHPVYRVACSLPDGLPKIHEHDGAAPRGFGLFLEGRLAVFYSHEADLGNGWEDPEAHDLPDSLRERALAMGVNLVVFALTQRAP